MMFLITSLREHLLHLIWSYDYMTQGPLCLWFSVTPQNEQSPLVQDEEDLFVIEQSSQDFLKVTKAEYIGYKKLVQRERQLLYKPSFRTGIICCKSKSVKSCNIPFKLHLYPVVTVPTSVKLPENTKPRYLEDEGLYVGERPPVSLTNENIMEHRILKMEEVETTTRIKSAEWVWKRHQHVWTHLPLVSFTKGKKWFGTDGRIIALPDPIKESSTRHPLFHMEADLDPALQTVYRKVRQETCITNSKFLSWINLISCQRSDESCG